MERQCRDSTSTRDNKINVDYVSLFLNMKAVVHLHLGVEMFRNRLEDGLLHRIYEMLRRFPCFCFCGGIRMPTTLSNWQRGRPVWTFLSVRQTHEGAIGSANQTSCSSLLELNSYSEDIKRLRDIFGMNHHESIYVLDAWISWNAFNGTAIIWIWRTV